MSKSMLISGKPEESPRFGNVEIGPGLDFISETIIDTHFSQRGRCGRLMTAVAHYPQDPRRRPLRLAQATPHRRRSQAPRRRVVASTNLKT
ncbi:MAG TPA: hypothetical protein VGK82_08485 [Pyrinomonadaceae bacterium]